MSTNRITSHHIAHRITRCQGHTHAIKHTPWHHKANTAETMQTPITMVGVAEQVLVNSRRLPQLLVGSCSGAAAMILRRTGEAWRQ